MPDEKPPLDVNQLLAALTKAGTDVSARERVLIGENVKYRNRIRSLKEQVKTATGKVPEGAIVLQGDEAKLYQEFKALELKPADIKAVVTERDTLKGKVAESEAAKLFDEAAQEAGYNAKILAKVAKAEGLTVTMEQIKVKDDEGKTVLRLVPHVKRADDKDGKPEPLVDFAEEHLAEWMPALTASSQDGIDGDETTGRTSGSKYDQAPSHEAPSPTRRPASGGRRVNDASEVVQFPSQASRKSGGQGGSGKSSDAEKMSEKIASSAHEYAL